MNCKNYYYYYYYVATLYVTNNLLRNFVQFKQNHLFIAGPPPLVWRSVLVPSVP